MNIIPFPKPPPSPKRETLYLDGLDDRMVLVRGDFVPFKEWLEGELDEAATQGFWRAWRAWAFCIFLVVSILWFGWAIYIWPGVS